MQLRTFRFIPPFSFLKAAAALLGLAAAAWFAPPAFPQRLLMLDKNMLPWQSLVEHARPWIEAGCRVEYRPYDPFLVEQDLETYDLIWIRGGRMPLFSSAFLSREDVDLLKRFVQQGKAVILVYPIHANAAGAYDRQAMNQFLREIQANIQIGGTPLTDSLHQYQTLTGTGLFAVPGASLRQSTKHRVPIGQIAPLKILKDARAEVLAFSYSTAFFRKKHIAYRADYPLIAVVQAGNAFILILPESASQIHAQGDHANYYPILTPAAADSARDFLHTVVQRFLDLTRNRNALKITPSPVLSAIPTRTQTELRTMVSRKAIPQRQPYPVKTIMLTRSHLLDPEMIALRESVTMERLRTAGFFQRYFKNGLRILVDQSIPVSEPSAEADNAITSVMKAMFTLMKEADISLLVSRVQRQGRPTVRIGEWKPLLQAARDASMRGVWLPAFSLDALPDTLSPVLGVSGQTIAVPTPFDRLFWWQGLIKPATYLTERLYRLQPISPGLAVDVGFYRRKAPPHFSMGHDFSDAAFEFFLAANRGVLSESDIQEARALPAGERFAFLVKQGWLPLYYATLELEIEKMARSLRRQVDAVAPNRLWLVQSRNLPNRWFLRGLLRGLSDPEQPVILLTHEPLMQPYLTWLQEEEIYLLHGLAIYPARFRKSDFNTLLKFARRHHHGFWLAMDSQLLRTDRFPLRDGEISFADLARLLNASAAQ